MKIKPDSEYYKGTLNDPKDKIGNIDGVIVGDSVFIFRVKWEITTYNVYQPKDLVLVN